MSTFGEVRQEILVDLNRTSAGDLTSTCEVHINEAIDFYERRRFWFMEQRATTTTTDGQEYYALPDDFRDDDSLVITVSNNSYQLNRRTYDTLEDWFVTSSTFTGYPTDYAIYQEQIRLYPVPNGAYEMRLSYIKQLSALSAEGDGNEWTNEGKALIKNRAMWSLFARKLRDYDAAQACKILETEELGEHEKLTKSRLMTGYSRKRKI